MKLEELTEKIYAEGVEKGNQEAQEIIARAEEKAAQIIAAAEQTAKNRVAEAEQKAAELDKNTRSELRMFAEQSVNALRTEVTNLLTGRIAQDNVKAATQDPKFMQQVILKMAETMAKDGHVAIEAKDAEALNNYFAQNAKALLDKGVSIEQVKGLKTDFQIRAGKGGYKLAFGNDEFVAYFKEFLRPGLAEMLF